MYGQRRRRRCVLLCRRCSGASGTGPFLDDIAPHYTAVSALSSFSAGRMERPSGGPGRAAAGIAARRALISLHGPLSRRSASPTSPPAASPPGTAAERLRRLGYSSVGDFALLDVSRAARKGVPEVVYAEGKTVGPGRRHRPPLPRARPRGAVQPRHATSRRRRWPAASTAPPWSTTSAAGSWSCAARTRRRRQVRGAVGVLAAGTSDVAVAGEAVAMMPRHGRRRRDRLRRGRRRPAPALGAARGDARRRRRRARRRRRHGGRAAVGRRRPRRRAGDRPADVDRLRLRRPRRGGAAGHAAELQPRARRREHRQRHRRRRHRRAHRPAAPPDEAPSRFVLRDHRERALAALGRGARRRRGRRLPRAHGQPARRAHACAPSSTTSSPAREAEEYEAARRCCGRRASAWPPTPRYRMSAGLRGRSTW